jgi:Peptidase family M28
MRRSALVVLVSISTAGHVSSQTTPAATHAAGSITPQDVARRIGIIADDSMLGRDTPSRGLEMTAEYVAGQFRSFGLAPGGDSSSWLQRYAVSRRRLDPTRSRMVLSVGRNEADLPFTRAVRHLMGSVPDKPLLGAGWLVSGPVLPEAAGSLAVKDRIVLVPFQMAELQQAPIQQALAVLFSRKPKAIVLLTDRDSAGFAGKISQFSPERIVIGPQAGPVALEVREASVAGVLRAAGIDLSKAHSAERTTLREVPALQLRIEMRDTVSSTFSVPNAVGILEGTDPVLKHEYLVYSAHMDHIGITPGQPDSINNGADDDGSGTAGVMELAEAFSRPGARPKRSIIFLTVSGEEKGLWGSDYFTSHPPVPITQIVADINIDMIGRNWPDTIVAIGKEHSDLGATLNRVNAAHRDLGMTAIDDRWPEERFYFRSDHFNFARRGVPILFFFNGVHADYHEVTDSPDKINSEKEARILRLLFYLGEAVANAPARPKWNPDSYKEIVEAGD